MNTSQAKPALASSQFWFAACLIVLGVQVTTEYMMGRVPICTCGYVKLWEGAVQSSGNSQHLSDWYTPSHIIHGFLFYGLGYLLLKGRPLSMRLLLAVAIESGWEILENSPLIIERYRATTISLDYVGDSILNSGMDTVSMAVGFFFAARASVWLTMALAIAFELLAAYVVHDNLTLNVLMLVWPLEAVKAWQSAI